jgi:hypothetical protein
MSGIAKFLEMNRQFRLNQLKCRAFIGFVKGQQNEAEDRISDVGGIFFGDRLCVKDASLPERRRVGERAAVDGLWVAICPRPRF